MRAVEPGLAVAVLLLGLLAAGCEAFDTEPPTSRALVLDRNSLPTHRHGDQLERMERLFLDRQQPGDRLLVAGIAAEDGENGGARSELIDLRLNDRPLVATRSVRRLHERLRRDRDGGDHEALAHLPGIARALAETPPPACLYLAMDPERAVPPPSDPLVLPRGPGGMGWSAFLLVPDTARGDRPDINRWIAHLHGLGASRIKAVSLDAELPECE